MSSEESSVYRAWQAADSSRRRFRRWFVDMPSTLYIGNEANRCVIGDLSPLSAGVRLAQAKALAVGTEVALDLGGFGSVSAEVRSSDHLHLGLKFLHDERDARVLARHLISLPPARRIGRRRAALKAILSTGNGDYPCTIEDISRIGACMLLGGVAPLSAGDVVAVRGEGFPETSASVRWSDGLRLGLMFLEVLATEAAPETYNPGSDSDKVRGATTSESDFLPGLKLAIEAHVAEQVRRRSEAEPRSDWKELVDSYVAREREKLEQLAKRFKREAQLEAGCSVRELKDDWLVSLGERLKSEK